MESETQRQRSAEQRTMLMEDEEEEEEEGEDGASHTRITRNQIESLMRTGRIRNASFDVDGNVGNIIAVNTTTRVDEDEDAEETTNLSAMTSDGNEEQQTNKRSWRRNLKRGSKVYVWYVEESRWTEGEIVEVEIRGNISKQHLRIASVVNDKTVIFKIARNSKYLADAQHAAHVMKDGISDLLHHVPHSIDSMLPDILCGVGTAHITMFLASNMVMLVRVLMRKSCPSWREVILKQICETLRSRKDENKLLFFAGYVRKLLYDNVWGKRYIVFEGNDVTVYMSAALENVREKYVSASVLLNTKSSDLEIVNQDDGGSCIKHPRFVLFGLLEV